MMQIEWDYYITPDGVTHTLADFKVRAIPGGIGGLGMPPIEWQTSRGPYEQGETSQDYRLRPRTIDLIALWKGCGREEYWALRSAILDIFRPNRSATNLPGYLRKVLPDGSIRDIATYVLEGPVFGQTDPESWQEWSYQEVVRLIAFDPTLFDPEQKLLTMNAGADHMHCPGTFLSWPVIELTGILTNPVVTNVTTGKAITFAAYTIAAGRTVTIDLTPGRKTVVDDLAVNLIGYVTGDLTTWRLEVDPIAPLGVNQMTLAGAGGGHMHIRWYDKWIGI